MEIKLIMPCSSSAHGGTGARPGGVLYRRDDSAAGEEINCRSLVHRRGKLA